MKRILIIDNNVMPSYWGAKDLARFAALTPASTVEVRRGPQNDIPRDLARFDVLVISGSLTGATEEAPWIDRLLAATLEFLKLERPMLGVCYGHQMIARAVGGAKQVRRGPHAEFGWTRIEQVDSSELLKGLPTMFHSFCSHFDEVTELPTGFRLLARSDLCAIQAYQVRDLPVYGIQFHPEKPFEAAQEIIANRRKTGEPKVLMNPDGGKRLYSKEVGETLFRNFFSLK